MALSALDDKNIFPNDELIRATLRRAATHWEAVKSHLLSNFSPLEEVWSNAGEKYGWSLRLIHKKRTIMYMTPLKASFYAGFVLGEKAFRAAHEAGLPREVLKVIDTAPKYGEGRGFRIIVKTKADVESVKKLTQIKMTH